MVDVFFLKGEKMSKKLLFVALISLSSQVASVGFSGSVGVGALLQKTAVEIEGKDTSNTAYEFEKDGNAGYFAGKAFATLGITPTKSTFVGLRVSASLMNDKKKHDYNNATSKSNFAFHVGPELGYMINDKFCVSVSGLFAYKNIKIKMVDTTKSEVEADKKNYYGFGGLVGAFYNINNMFSVGLEGGADYMLKRKDNVVKFNASEVKFDVKRSFVPNVGLVAKVSFGK